MRIDRIRGVVLSILVITFAAYKYIDGENVKNPFELIGDSGYISDNVATLDNTFVDDETKGSSEVFTFTNKHSYPVLLNQNDITINCTGNSDDVALVEANYDIKAKFSNEKNSDLYNSLYVDEGKQVYVHVISSYDGQLPESEVSCEYSLEVSAS